MHIYLHGGKTAPRLLQDLKIYDPRKQTSSGFNILSQIPFYDGDQDSSPQPVGKGSCKHQWSMKRNQCILRENRVKPDYTTLWTIAAYCAVCRSHLELSLDFTGIESDFVPCPTHDRPLHHFLHKPEFSQSRLQPVKSCSQSGVGFTWVDYQAFECSAYNCPAQLTICFKPPRLIPEWVSQLTDQVIIKHRAEKVIAGDPKRFEGHSIPQPIDVLKTMQGYLDNAMYIHEQGKKIIKTNKKWMLNLGDSCADVLEYIGFTREEDGGWMPPEPECNANPPFHNPINIRLDDIHNEIQTLMSKRPDYEKRAAKLEFNPEGVMQDLNGALGCLEYQQDKRSRTIDLTKEEHPYYAGLGTVEDFHDDLIVFAYDCQKETDPVNTSYYLECLQGIAGGRSSEKLQTKVAIEASNDILSFRDVRAAYKELGLSSQIEYEDDTILGTFHSRIADAPKQEAELRRALLILGQTRSSHKIQAVASQTLTTYEQALAYFDIQFDVSDEFIPSIYALKISETPSAEPTARHAVALIAKHRHSHALKQLLESGDIGKVKIDSAEAYALLDIHNQQDIDDDTILAVYDTRLSDTSDSERRKKLSAALTAIATARNSTILKNVQGISEPQHGISEWPVGLQNIGNTCYLNSMLQSYFTIKPLRELVLGIEEFTMTVNQENLLSKRVGGRLITEEEVSRSQRFGFELRKLFKDMIESPNFTVRPETKLVHLALIKAKKVDEVHKNSTNLVQDLNPSLQADQTDQEDTEMLDVASLDSEASNTINGGSNDDRADSLGSSPATMHGDDSDNPPVVNIRRKSEARGPEDKENLPPTTGTSKGPGKHGQSSPSGSVEAAHTGMEDSSADIGALPVQGHSLAEETSATAPHPDRPPPVPPRPSPMDADLLRQQEAEKPLPRPTTEEEKLLDQAEKSASRQEDVQELIDNVLFQLQCAIKAEDTDAGTEEQIDRIKRLFYGKQKVYITDASGIRPQENYMFNIIVDASKGSIYGALDDSIYCERTIDVANAFGSEHTTITQLPPILQIFVERTAFKEGTGTFKMNDHLQLQDTIYMDRYMDSSIKTDLGERHRKIWRWKKGIEELIRFKGEFLLEDQEDGNAASRFKRAVEELQQFERTEKTPFDIPDDLQNKVEMRVERYETGIAKCDARIERIRARCASEFDDLKDMEYRLQSVFVHQGGSHAGHYWVYIYDFVGNMWRKYNDGTVTEATRADVFEPNLRNPNATPYFLVYVRADQIEELVDCVCRDPVQEEPKDDPDTKMEGSDDVVEITEGHCDSNASQKIAGDGWAEVSKREDGEYEASQTSAGWNNSQALHDTGRTW